tara:strand:+ start:404 stop:595 length:192 start_codon:yes stop_codon:yes gene_type:complete
MLTIGRAPNVIDSMESVLKFENIYNQPSADGKKGGGGGRGPPTGFDDWGGGGGGSNSRTLSYD